MYLRRHRRTVDDTTCEYWTLVASRRTASGPRQHTIATLGKLPGLDAQVQAGWDTMEYLLEGRTPARQLELTGSGPELEPLWREVNLRGVRVERVREFGQVYPALSLWRRLGLQNLLNELIPSGREEVPWERTACLLTLARFCAQPSELEMWMRGKGLGNCARQLVGEIATIKSLDIVLPVKTAEGVSELRLRTVARPERLVAELLQRLGLHLPEQSRIIQNAVENVVRKTGV